VVFFHQVFQLFLRGRRAGQRDHVGSKLDFATLDALGDDPGVVRLGIQPEKFLIMIDGGGRVGFLRVKQAGQLKMRRCRARIDLQRFGERLDRTRIIHRVDAAFAEDKVRLFFLIQLAGIRRRTTADSQQSHHRRKGPSSNRVSANSGEDEGTWVLTKP